MADDFLDDVFPEAEALPMPEDVVQEPEATVEPEPEAVAEPTLEPVAEPASERPEHVVPLPKYLDTRDELKEARRKLAEYEAQANQRTVPDSFDDPEGHTAYLRSEMQAALQAQKVDISWAVSVQQHGEDTVKAARDWALEKAQKDPGFRSALDAEFSAQPMPIDWIVRQHKRDVALSTVGDDPDAWFVQEAAKRGYAPLPAPAAVAQAATPQQASPPVKVPRSLATVGSGPSDVREVATGPLAGVDALFT